MDYDAWERTVPAAITADSLWLMKAYRLALFAAHIGWDDVTRLSQDHRTRALSDQLYRALGSISANIAEGYSRGYTKERARFYEYALGSARESRDWYFKAGHILGQDTIEERLSLLTQVIKLLLTMVPDQRARSLREEMSPYQPDERTSSPE